MAIVQLGPEKTGLTNKPAWPGINGSAIYALWVFMPFGYKKQIEIRLERYNLSHCFSEKTYDM